MPILLLICMSCYLCGSLSFAMLSSHFFRLEDPRTYGSGNMGATNIARSGHKRAAIATLCGDIGKALLPIWWVSSTYPGYILLTSSFAILGHMYPIFYRGRGGKGVATTLGVFIVIDPSISLLFTLMWAGIFYLFRISALSAIGAFSIVCACTIYKCGLNLYSSWMFFLVALILLKHYDNIRLLWARKY